jgi:hypothetical protein
MSTPCCIGKCAAAPPAQLTSTVPATFPSGSLALTCACAHTCQHDTCSHGCWPSKLPLVWVSTYALPRSSGRHTVSTTKLPTLFPTSTTGWSINSAMKSRTRSTHLHDHATLVRLCSTYGDAADEVLQLLETAPSLCSSTYSQIDTVVQYRLF